MIKKAGMLLLAIGAIILINNGCKSTGTETTEWKPSADSVNKPPYVHIVKYSGETLPILSKWYTGDVKNWEILADANPNIDFEQMIIGSRIFIPEALLKTRDSLTEEYIKIYNEKPKPKEEKIETKPVSKPKPKPKPKKDEDFDLIGPK